MMTPEEKLDEARAKEALREADEANRYFTFLEVATLAARLAREGWTPPEPVDPDVLAFREWYAGEWPFQTGESILAGAWDHGIAATGYLAGARMARERERERAKVLVDRLSDLVERVTHDGKRDYVTGVNAGEMISARVTLARYRGEA